MSERDAVQAIRFLDNLVIHNLDVLGRLDRAGRRGPLGRRRVYDDAELDLLIGDAERTHRAIEESLERAERLVATSGRRIPDDARIPPAPVEVPRELAARIGLRATLAARARAEALKQGWPEVDWAEAREPADIDLFARKRRTALIVAGVVVAGFAVLAIVAPQVATGIGVVLLLLILRYVTRYPGSWLSRLRGS
jgi:hypothetical protein